MIGVAMCLLDANKHNFEMRVREKIKLHKNHTTTIEGMYIIYVCIYFTYVKGTIFVPKQIFLIDIKLEFVDSPHT